MYTQFIESDKIKLKSSFFVGDALGRPNDWSNTDKLFGENIGFTIKTPEEIFQFDVNQINNQKKMKFQQNLLHKNLLF